MKAKRLAILSTHPIQYHSAWFRALAKHPAVELEVFYCHRATGADQARAGFGVEFEWDVPLLGGYRHQFLTNVAPSHHGGGFRGYDTPEIRSIIEGRSFDAVLVNGWHYKSAWQAIFSCWKHRIPLMLRGDSHLGTLRGLVKRAVKYPVYKALVSRAQACLAAGTWSREYFLHYGAAPERVFSVPHAIDEEWFAAERSRWLPRREVLRSHWQLDPQATVFLFAGKFIPKKRPLDFVQAAHAAAAGGARVAGLMVGDGPLRAACEAYARDQDAPVRFAGFLNQSQMVSAYVASDVLVLPSDGRETWGLVVNEAMSCGRPCIVSDAVGCGPDLIIAGKTGNIYPLARVQALGELMKWYAERPAAMRQMAEGARERVAEFSLAAAVGGLLDALMALEGGQKAERS